MTGGTEVALLHVPGRQEHWLRFGQHWSERIIDRRRRTLLFRPGAVFAFIRWASNDHGTIESRIDIARAGELGESVTCLPYIEPGAVSLLRAAGWPKVRQVLNLIDEAERVCGDAADVNPDYWQHVHQRLITGLTPARYSASRHRAWLLRRKLDT
ncbi:DUF2840 domain-containing protein [Sandaracinobacteroides saxicola]|uniref:DUF2840 domain-containing protein n=1 Tax=Sandaracinobacteroides saxicola TaxID=2759707 RepID=A0A7G5IGI3_9SPHN|nr:DUF2840 domain-containing protein [Sandaracinobacteroides saxicola]QMW22475.1 DUF2840 domain-containing protein [Sandaracinobacteroides saxicola]